MKSTVMRSLVLQLVAEVVHWLSNHTIKTLGSDELQLLQRQTDDVVAVGFFLNGCNRGLEIYLHLPNILSVSCIWLIEVNRVML